MEQAENVQKPQKSTYWKATIIISNIIAVGIVGLVIWSIIAGFIFPKPEPSFVPWLDWGIRLVLGILGVWYGVRYVSKKSTLYARESTKLAVLAILLPVLFSVGLALYQYFRVIARWPDLLWVIQSVIWIVLIFVSTQCFVKKFAIK